VRLDPALLGRIKAAAVLGWTSRPIPAPIDDDLATLVDAYAASNEAWRREITAGIDEEIAAALLGYAERMASLGARTRSDGPVERGLLAAALAWEACPEITHAIVALGVLYEAGRRAGDPARLFGAAAELAPSDAAQGLRAFLTRRDLDRVAAEMGFIEGEDADGFRFYRVW
jgi:hypothetical protein